MAEHEGRDSECRYYTIICARELFLLHRTFRYTRISESNLKCIISCCRGNSTKKNPSNSSILTVRFTNNARNSSILIGLQKFFGVIHRHSIPSSKTCLACGLVFWETRWDECFWKWQKLRTLNSEKLQEINVSDFSSVIISAKITGTNSLGNWFVIQPGTMVVDPAECPKNSFTKPGFWEHFVVLSPGNSKTQSSVNFLWFGPLRFTTSDFSGSAPICWVLIKAMKRKIVIRENQTYTESWLPFCVAFAPLFPRGIGPFPVPEKFQFPLLWKALLFLQDLLHESTVFPHQETTGQKLTRNGGPQIGACLILAASGFSNVNFPWASLGG